MPTARLFDFEIVYHSEAEYHALKDEIFTKDTYYVDLDTLSPQIIDAGAHVGLTTLYFKHLYPSAKILAIEPHPKSFQLLKQNIEANHLDNTTLLEAALVNSDDKKVTLYADPEATWLQSASLTKGAWNKSENKVEAIIVPATRLSQLISESVDLLKIDVEGVESAVIDDLIQKKKLRHCKNLVIEFHQTKGKDLNTFIKKLEQQKYQLVDNKWDQKRTKTGQNGLYVLHFSVSE